MSSTLWTTKHDLFAFVENRKIIGRKSPSCGARAALLQPSPLAHPVHIVPTAGTRRRGCSVKTTQPSRPSHWSADDRAQARLRALRGDLIDPTP